MRKGRDGEKMEKKKMENNGENSGPLTSLPVNRLTATDCNAAARANTGNISTPQEEKCTYITMAQISLTKSIFELEFLYQMNQNSARN